MMSEEYKNYNESQKTPTLVKTAAVWTALALCVAVITAATVEQLIHHPPANTGAFAPGWLPFTAALITSAGIIRLDGHSQWLSVQPALRWSGLFLLVWAANGLPLDLLRLTPLIPLSVDWPGLVTKTSAFTAAVVMARIVLSRTAGTSSTGVATWYGYAAFLLALPYPILRTCWALGGTPGLMHPGAAGEGFLPWLASIPWLLAAVLSLLLISARSRLPRKLLLTAGWFATAVVAMIGPAACWSLVSQLIEGNAKGPEGMALWVPCLFYGSWLLWAIAAGAATRSYQLRSAGTGA